MATKREQLQDEIARKRAELKQLCEEKIAGAREGKGVKPEVLKMAKSVLRLMKLDERNGRKRERLNAKIAAMLGIEQPLKTKAAKRK